MNLYEAIIPPPGPVGIRVCAYSNYFHLIGSLAGTSTCVMLFPADVTGVPYVIIGFAGAIFLISSRTIACVPRARILSLSFPLSFSGCRRRPARKQPWTRKRRRRRLINYVPQQILNFLSFCRDGSGSLKNCSFASNFIYVTWNCSYNFNDIVAKIFSLQKHHFYLFFFVENIIIVMYSGLKFLFYEKYLYVNVH